MIMQRMKDKHGNYDFGIVERVVGRYLESKRPDKVRLSFPSVTPPDLAMAMVKYLAMKHDIIVEQTAQKNNWSMTLIGIEDDK